MLSIWMTIVEVGHKNPIKHRNAIPSFCVYLFSECNCHGKAEECYFNQTVADLSLSLDIHGKYRGGGVCISCRDNTAGINCQTCVAGYYRPAGVCQTRMHLCALFENHHD